MASAANPRDIATGLAHIFLGLMKADGNISLAERETLERLLGTQAALLPVRAPDILAALRSLLMQDAVAAWPAHQHLSAAFIAFDHAGHLATDAAFLGMVQNLLEALMAVDGIEEVELHYLHSSRAEVQRRLAQRNQAAELQQQALAYQNSCTALAHYFVALMKADGRISTAEDKALRHLLDDHKGQLPARPTDILERVAYLRSHVEYSKWQPHQHVATGFMHYDFFLRHSALALPAMAVMLQMLEQLMHVDGIHEAELQCLALIRDEVARRSETIA